LPALAAKGGAEVSDFCATTQASDDKQKNVNVRIALRSGCEAYPKGISGAAYSDAISLMCYQ